jgi:hypothetical protein
MYNRLNFFIRHLQLEHQISDFKKVKEIIENSTFQKRKTKKKSRIRAKTLEGLVDDSQMHSSSGMRSFNDSYNISEKNRQSNKSSRRSRKRGNNTSEDSIMGSTYGSYKSKKDLDDFIDNGFGSSKYLLFLLILGSSHESRKSGSILRSNEKQINPVRARFLSPYDNHSYSNPENESKGSLQLKELMHNINIMCMMENNYRKFFSTQKKIQNGSMVSRCFEKNEIILGKRGRPSKTNSQSPSVVPEKIMGSYLNSFQNSAENFKVSQKRRVPKPIYNNTPNRKKSSSVILCPSESLMSMSMELSNKFFRSNPKNNLKPKLIPKPKELRVKCPVYFDEMVMELLYISQKQTTQTPIFLIKRNSVFEQMDGKLVSFNGRHQFQKEIRVEVGKDDYLGDQSEFDLLKMEKKMAQNGHRISGRNDKHYNFGAFIDNLKTSTKANKYKGNIANSFFSDKRPRSMNPKTRKKKRKYKIRKKNLSLDGREKTNHSYCEYCHKTFDSFLQFLHHVQTVHQKNIEEIV